jgi:hypothetical protein
VTLLFVAGVLAQMVTRLLVTGPSFQKNTNGYGTKPIEQSDDHLHFPSSLFPAGPRHNSTLQGLHLWQGAIILHAGTLRLTIASGFLGDVLMGDVSDFVTAHKMLHFII